MIDELHTTTYADEAEMEVRAILRRLNRMMNYADPYEVDPAAEYEQLASRLEQMAAEVRSIIGHQHQWNADDYCDVCGMDGRS